MLIGQTVIVALEKGIIKSKSIIVNATHKKSKYNQKSVSVPTKYPERVMTLVTEKEIA